MLNYRSSMVYDSSGTPEYVPHPEGMTVHTGNGQWEWRYHLSDYLGNTRAVLDENGAILQQTDYHPFGAAYTLDSTNENKYLYGGKELQDEVLGGTQLNMYDFGARFYDPQYLLRFTGIDPLAEKYYNVSPYVYCLNNPINLVDPDGKDIIEWFLSLFREKTASDPEGEGARFRNDNARKETLKEINETIVKPTGEALEPIAEAMLTPIPFGNIVLDKATDKETTSANVITEVGIEVVSAIIPGGSIAKGVMKEGVRTVGKTAARLSSNSVKLAKQLASESQMAEKGITVIGKGNLKEAGRLAKEYGGNTNDWIKKSSSSYTNNGAKFETHWYENTTTGQRVEYKTKFP